VLPWLGPNPDTGVQPFNCSTCQDSVPEEIGNVIKATWHCGWMDRTDWKGETPEYPVIPGYDCDVCPGYLLNAPLIREAQTAVGAFRMGQLKEFFPFLEATVLTATMELHGAYNRYEQEQINKPR